MTTPRDPDLVLAAWLDEGPTRLPADTRRAILVSTRITRQQRRRSWLPWRTSMLSITRVAVLAMVIAVVGPIGLNLLRLPARSSPPGPIDTSAWTTYVSDRYGFSIGHPADWTERPAVGTWSLAKDTDWLTQASEGFIAPGDDVLATAWSVPVEPGTTVGSWLAAYCPVNTKPCSGLQERTIPVTMDGHPGSLVRFADDTQAFILVDDRMYVVAVWEPDSDPRTAPYGGATRLLEGYLSTMHLLPGGPAIDSSEWPTYTSDRYGFRIGHPADWTERPALSTWTLAQANDFLTLASEGFKAPADTVLATAWSVPVEPGTTVESWLGTYCPLNTKPCTGLEDLTTPVTVDGHPGSLVRFADDTQAFVLVDDRMYVAAVWEPDSDPRTAPYGGATPLLKGFLSTIHLLPGGPAPSASAAALDTAAWVPYESERYGFGFAHPADWTIIPATHDWTMAEAADWLSNGADAFRISAGEGIRVSAWKAPVEARHVDRGVDSRPTARSRATSPAPASWTAQCRSPWSGGTSIRASSCRSRTTSRPSSLSVTAWRSSPSGGERTLRPWRATVVHSDSSRPSSPRCTCSRPAAVMAP